MMRGIVVGTTVACAIAFGWKFLAAGFLIAGLIHVGYRIHNGRWMPLD